MDNKLFDKLISKYAILLSVLYLGNVLLIHFGLLQGFYFLAYFYITNIIVALTVNYDLKKNDIKSSITVWSCVFFDALGVSLFFIQIIRQEKKSSA